MRGLVNVFFFSSFFISLCAAALSAATCVLLGVEVSSRITGFIFCGTLFIYNSHALFSGHYLAATRDSERHIWVKNNRNWLLVLSFLALAGCVFLLNAGSSSFYFWLAHLVLLAIGYTVPVIRLRGRWINLRSAPLLKVLLIAYVWAAVTVQLPLLNLGYSLSETFTHFILYGRFLFILALAPLFDIRDVDRDTAARIITLPNLIGLRAAKLVSAGLLLIFIALVTMHYPVGFAAALGLSAVAAIFVVASAKPGHSERFYSGWADGMMLLQAVLVFVAAALW